MVGVWMQRRCQLLSRDSRLYLYHVCRRSRNDRRRPRHPRPRVPRAGVLLCGRAVLRHDHVYQHPHARVPKGQTLAQTRRPFHQLSAPCKTPHLPRCSPSDSPHSPSRPCQQCAHAEETDWPSPRQGGHVHGPGAETTVSPRKVEVPLHRHSRCRIVPQGRRQRKRQRVALCTRLRRVLGCRCVRGHLFASSLTLHPGLPTAISPLTRSPDFQLPPHHPHARKQSVTDVHIHLNEVQQPSPPPPSGLASSSVSTFSLALDPIAETPTTPYPGSPLPRSPSLTGSLDRRSFETTAHACPPRPPQSRRPSQLGLGHGPPPPNLQSKSTPSLRNGSLVSSNSELILYSYAQLLGTVSIAPLPGVVMIPDQAQALATLRLKLLKRTVVGGGSMDITSHQRIQERRRSHSRSASLTGSLFSLLSPSTYSAPSTPLPSSQSWAPGRSRTPSVSSALSGTPVNGHQNGLGLGLINGGTEEDIDPDVPLPTFDVQPAMLAVDLMLGPGESRTCELPFYPPHIH